MNGNRHGIGKLYYKDGSIKYEGDFENNTYDGEGKYNYENGEYYIGDWLNGNRHGIGKLYDKDGNVKNEGFFHNDSFKGNVKYSYNDCNNYRDSIGGGCEELYKFKNDICSKCYII